MATYDKFTSIKNPGRKVQVESAIRDGSGKNIENNYAKQNGSYENMSVGNADNLTPYGDNSGVNDTTPFVFQSSGGGSDIGSLAQLKELRGNTVKFNQLYRTENSSVSDGGITRTKDATTGLITVSGTATEDVTFAVIPAATQESLNSTHKYLYKWNFKGSINDNSLCFGNQIIIDGWNKYWDTDGIGLGRNANTYLQCKILTGAIVDFTIQPQICDLTEMFGAGNEPTSVVEFNRLFPKPYYAYDSGSLLSCKSSGYKVVGYNQLATQPTISYNTGYITGFIKVISGQRYTFEIGEYQLSSGDSFGNMFFDEYDENQELIKSYNLVLNEQGEDSVNTKVTKGSHTLGNNTHYVKIKGYVASPKTINSISNCCFHLTWDGSKTGYEEYKSQTFQLPNVELRSVSSIYDSITPNGTLTRRLGIVDLGTLSWNYNDSGSNPYFYSSGISSTAKVDGQSICSKYGNVKLFNADKNIFINTSNSNLIAVDNSYTDADTFKSSLNGVYLIYELETPTTEQVSTFVENTSIDDWGTQEFISSESIVIPQVCDFFYVVDYKAFIDSLGEREDINYDASKVVSQTELQTALGNIDLSAYGALANDNSWSGNNTIAVNKELRFSTNNTSNYFFIKADGNSFKIGAQNISTALNIGGRLTSLSPDNNNTQDLGKSGYAWKDLYLGGNIKGMETITQAQYDALVSGGTVDADTFYFITEN